MASEPRVEGTGTMDYVEHNKTYELFVRMVSIVTPVFLSWLLAVGIGGMKHRPLLAFLVVMASLVVGVAGLASRAIGWLPSLAVLALSFVVFVLA